MKRSMILVRPFVPWFKTSYPVRYLLNNLLSLSDCLSFMSFTSTLLFYNLKVNLEDILKYFLLLPNSQWIPDQLSASFSFKKRCHNRYQLKFKFDWMELSQLVTKDLQSFVYDGWVTWILKDQVKSSFWLSRNLFLQSSCFTVFHLSLVFL